jgi:endonuclease/exonuclease/phosphatase family metal-dependent hydrolase
MIPKKISRRLVLAAPVGFFGLALVLSGPFAQGAEPGAPATRDPILFVGYNLKNYLRMDRRVDGEFREMAPKPEKEKAAIVKILAKIRPDIIGVSEIGDMADVVDLQTRLKMAGVDLPYIEWMEAFDTVRHVAALSRYPFVSRSHQRRLTYTMGDREFEFKRGIFDATVEVNPVYRLRMLGLHLKSKREVPEGDQAEMRRNEAELLRRHAVSILDKGGETNLLLFGDFNDTRNEATIKAIQGRFGSEKHLRDIQAKDVDGYKWTYCWSYADIYSRFDFVFVSKGLYPEVDSEKSFIAKDPDWFTASDHRPVAVKITPVNKPLP